MKIRFSKTLGRERKKTSNSNRKITKKSVVTQKMILEAAKRIFARHSYRNATLRMIGQEGGFNFTLINHYFSKAALFEAVTAEALEDLFSASSAWMEGLEQYGIEKGLSVFLDRALDYLFAKPQAVLLLMNNILQEDTEIRIPGIAYFAGYVSDTGNKMIHDYALRAEAREVAMWVYAMINQMISYVGFSSYHGNVLQMNPEGRNYKKWVKDSLMYLFLPPLQSMFEPAKDEQ